MIFNCASEGVNPLLSLPKLADLEGSPRVVALTDGPVSHGLDPNALLSLGADADIGDPLAVVEAVFPGGSTGAPHRRRRRRALAAA